MPAWDRRELLHFVHGVCAMPIVVACSCGKRFRAPDSAAGRRGKCPGCGGPIEVPRPTPPSLEDDPFGDVGLTAASVGSGVDVPAVNPYADPSADQGAYGLAGSPAPAAAQRRPSAAPSPATPAGVY